MELKGSRWKFWLGELRRRLFEQPVEAIVDRAPVDLRIVGRVLLHALMVGVGAGLLGVAFVRLLDGAQFLLLERFVGYVPLRASGEEVHTVAHGFRWWLVVPTLFLGGAFAGWIMRFAPETRGGGADATLEAYHSGGGLVRNRVLPAKAAASLATLATGGAGGREGPTIQIGGAVGSLVSRLLRVDARERRILLLAGAAAGISAVFRTPLGAALLIVEMVYSDGFENDALVPAVLSSVVSYAIATTIHPEGSLLGQAARYPFVPAHLPLYGVLALFTSLGAVFFLAVYERTKKFFGALKVPDWLKPAIGGAMLGLVVLAVVFAFSQLVEVSPRGVGLLGGGYGLVQMAISDTPLLGNSWPAVAFFAGMMIAKAFATSLTVGSGGSAGDFAPSMAMGGLIGGAFGRAARLLIDDPRIDPGAFVLVGMGAFYGGIAHAPLAALVMVCELAGTYDLLVPAMLAQGIAFVALRNH
ncbi:MAG: chloride channel protein, partial [Archangium sp.]|nr:chloride channel protein [Archangium sp.]